MRYVKIFFLSFQQVFEQRGRSFVWFLISLWGPLVTLLFWRGATNNGKILMNGWSYEVLVSYYFFQIIASALLISNVEDDVAKIDIQMGNLTKYLVRPIVYIKIKFLEDLPYRTIRGIFGIIVCAVFFIFLRGSFFVFAHTITSIVGALVICIFAFLISYVFKMVLGLIAFWLIEIRGIYEMVDAVMLIFAGFVMPISLLPQQIANIAYILPFSYMIYFPIVSVEGKLNEIQLLSVIGMQALWLFILFSTYQLLWRNGVKKFSGVGQ